MLKKVVLKKKIATWIVYENEQAIFYCKRKGFFLKKIYLTDINNKVYSESKFIGLNLFKLKVKFSTAKEIIISGGNLFYNTSFLTRINDSSYELVPHKNYRFSIFRDGVQIAAGRLPSIYSTNREEIEVFYKSNEYDEFILTFVITTLCDFSNNEVINIDFGRHSEKMPFNEGWS